MITAGIDIGSTTTKCVLLQDGKIISQAVIPAGILPSISAREVFHNCLMQGKVEERQIKAIATTGYGRRLADFGDLVVTEIKACAYGMKNIQCQSGKIYTIIDVGGQDTKIISLNEAGDVEDFAMNDKCAAGTGRFLEMLSFKLGMDYETFVENALTSYRTNNSVIQMNSTCAVFAESEVVSLLARGIDKKDIAAAAHYSIAERIGSMARRVGLKETICFTGGGARNKALSQAIEEVFNLKVFIPDSPQVIVALGAAIAAEMKIKDLRDAVPIR